MDYTETLHFYVNKQQAECRKHPERIIFIPEFPDASSKQFSHAKRFIP